MKKQSELFSIVLFAILVIFLATTNPSKNEFVEHIKHEYVDSSQNKIEHFFTSITQGIAGMTAKTCTRNNYVVFSTYEYAGSTYVGVVGHFFQIK